MRNKSYDLRKKFLRDRFKKLKEREKIFQTFLETLKEILNKKATIVLIGSRARGDSALYSDYDIVIFTQMEEEKAKQVILKKRPRGLPIDVIILPIEAINDKIVKQMLMDAKILYDGLGLKKRIIGIP